MLLRVHDSARSVSAVQQPPSQPIQQARRPRRCSHVLCCCFLPPSPRVRRLGGLGNPCLCPVALRLRNRNKQLSSAYLRDSTTLIQWCCAPSANLLPARTRKLRFLRVFRRCSHLFLAPRRPSFVLLLPPSPPRPACRGAGGGFGRAAPLLCPSASAQVTPMRDAPPRA